MRSLAVVALAGSFALLAPAARAAPPGNDYGHMHMLYERTWFGIDVARIDVWFDQGTRDRVRELAAGQRYSNELAEKIAQTVLDATDVNVQLVFLRDASRSEFFDGARENLAHARDAGYLTPDQYAIAWRGVQTDFAGFARRGFRDGDRLLYRARADGSLQTQVVAGGGVLLDVTSRDAGARRAMIASYFAPKSDFRKGLIKSVF